MAVKAINIFKMTNMNTGEIREGSCYKLSALLDIPFDSLYRAFKRGEREYRGYVIEYLGIKKTGKKAIQKIDISEKNIDPNIDEAAVLAMHNRVTYGKYQSNNRKIKTTFDVKSGKWIEINIR